MSPFQSETKNHGRGEVTQQEEMSYHKTCLKLRYLIFILSLPWKKDHNVAQTVQKNHENAQ